MTDTDTPTKPRRNLSEIEIFTAMGKLHACLRGPVGGLWTYAEGSSDQSIADEMGNGVTLANIVGLRERNFGKLTKGDITADPRITELQQIVFDLMLKHNALARALLPTTGTADPYIVTGGK